MKLDSLADKINEQAEQDALKIEKAKNKAKEDKKVVVEVKKKK